MAGRVRRCQLRSFLKSRRAGCCCQCLSRSRRRRINFGFRADVTAAHSAVRRRIGAVRVDGVQTARLITRILCSLGHVYFFQPFQQERQHSMLAVMSQRPVG